MEHRFILFIIGLFLLVIVGCTGGDETKIDSTSDFNIALERAQGYAYPSDTMNLDTAHQMGLALLEHDSVKTTPPPSYGGAAPVDRCGTCGAGL